MDSIRIAGLALVLAGCFHDAASGTAAPSPPAPGKTSVARTADPAVAIISSAEWEACEAAASPVLDNGIDHELYCDGQGLEGGTPLRYRNLPAISADGSVLAVVEERDGWGHVDPGIRLIDREGHSVMWLPLDGTGAAVTAAVARANAELRERAWVPLDRPAVTNRTLADARSETTLTLGSYTAVYERRDDGNFWLPPSRITVTANGRSLVSRTDTESAWLAQPRCNLPAFELVGASASPGVILFRTGLGMGGHNCDGVKQPPTWHVLAFEVR
ncbi:MAG: hypothetical protein ABI175_14790 [Polyangiales bacterium]